MTKKLACLTLGIACLVGAGVPAMAGGFDDEAGGLKDSIYDGVPVPAPQPIPEYEADYYMRADLGYSVSTASGATSSGQGFVVEGDGLDGPYAVSFGFGRYITSNVRGEIAFDIRNSYEVGAQDQGYLGVVTEDATSILNGGPGGTNRHYYDADRTDEVRIGHYTGMVNLYYDFKNGSRFTPYLGGGLGLVIHTMRRSHQEGATCNHSTNDTTGPEVEYQVSLIDTTPACTTGAILPGGDSDTNASDTTNYASVSNEVETAYGLAANVMAGFSYDLGRGKMLDLNYRYFWMGGGLDIVAPALNGTNRVTIEDSSEHQLRVGMRVNIN